MIGGAASNTVTANSAIDVFTAGIGNNTLIPGPGPVTFAIDADTDQGSDRGVEAKSGARR